MFTLDSIEQSLSSGVSPNRVPDEIRNRFTLRLPGYDIIDNRIQIKISPRQIRFYYYDNDYDADKWGKGYTKDYSYVKEVGYISLTRPKDTGNDLLDFPQNIASLDVFKVKDEKKETPEFVKKLFKEMKSCNDVWSNKFFNFPLANTSGIQEGLDHESLFRIFLRYCLLCFIFEYENRGMAFGKSPIYDVVREKLRLSDVYNLLSAKLQYTLYIPKDELAYNSEEYSYKVKKYADALMSERISKVIPPNDYSSINWILQSWFYNPEEELERLLEQNRKQEKKAVELSLEDSLVLKIRNYLYKKHAVSQAMTRSVSKKLFYCGQTLMALTTIVVFCAYLPTQIIPSDYLLNKVYPIIIALSSLVYTIYLVQDDWKNRKDLLKVVLPILILIIASILSLFALIQYPWFHLFTAIVIVGLILLSGFLNNANSKERGGMVYAFFPRILVAELAAWLTIGIAEDLVKSLLWVDDLYTVLGATIFVLFLISLIVGGEVIQHSPYLGLKKVVFQRVMPIINHSLFFALFFGHFFQLLFYDNLIKTSDVLPSIVFNSYFDDANYYCQNLEDLDNTINQYNEFIHILNSKNISLHGEAEGENRTVVDDTVEYKNYLSFVQKLESDPQLSIEDKEYHNILVQQINTISKELTSIRKKTIIKDSLLLLSDSLKIRKNINFNINTIHSLPISLLNEINSVRRNIMKYNDYETLMSWTTDSTCLVNTGSEFLDSITKMAQKKHKCSRIIVPNSKSDSKSTASRIFPILLIFHTLIVLVLAFITQLIISEKSVTEPL